MEGFRLVRTLVDCPALKIELGRAQEAIVSIPVEEPLALELNGEIRAILMRLPGADKELAVGFCVSEGLVGSFADILLVHHCGEGVAEAGSGATVAVTRTEALPPEAGQSGFPAAEDILAEDANRVRVLAPRAKGRQQDMEDYQPLLLRSGCGRTETFGPGTGGPGTGAKMAKAETSKVQAKVGPEAEAVIEPGAGNDSPTCVGANTREGAGGYAGAGVEPKVPGQLWVESNLEVSPAVLAGLRLEIPARQTVKRGSGGVHAAALFDAKGQLLVIHEDIGRHNAMDKIIGHALLWDLPLDRLIAVTTGRASYEMVTKAARVGLPILLSFSSPTSLAVEYAQACRLTIGGYLRGRSLIIHSHPWRLAR